MHMALDYGVRRPSMQQAFWLLGSADKYKYYVLRWRVLAYAQRFVPYIGSA
jgi:hypothetical protein